MPKQFCPSLKMRLWREPCAICGLVGDIEIDHIIAKADGGDGSPSNAQPLCRVCNILKREHKTNAAVREWICLNASAFTQRQRRRLETKRKMYRP